MGFQALACWGIRCVRDFSLFFFSVKIEELTELSVNYVRFAALAIISQLRGAN